MKELRKNSTGMLLVELQNLERQGITIWLGDRRCSSGEASHVMKVQESATYMRDYVFKEGELSEVRFDRITRR